MALMKMDENNQMANLAAAKPNFSQDGSQMRNKEDNSAWVAESSGDRE